jgi:hypothetical protein
MSDLVKRLRVHRTKDAVDAADHIEKLEAALREIVQHSEIYPSPNMRRAIDTMGKIARAALAPEQDK